MAEKEIVNQMFRGKRHGKWIIGQLKLNKDGFLEPTPTEIQYNMGKPIRAKNSNINLGKTEIKVGTMVMSSGAV